MNIGGRVRGKEKGKRGQDQRYELKEVTITVTVQGRKDLQERVAYTRWANLQKYLISQACRNQPYSSHLREHTRVSTKPQLKPPACTTS